MPSPRMLCLDCGYRLDHLDQHRCPECGREFDPADVATWKTPAQAERFTFPTSTAIIAVAVYSPSALILGLAGFHLWIASAPAIFFLLNSRASESEVVVVGAIGTFCVVLIAGFIGQWHRVLCLLLAMGLGIWSFLMSLLLLALAAA